MAGLEIAGIRKNFGEVVALDSVDISIDEGELFFLLGASGCGKTTLLRILAGFSNPDAGSVRFLGQNLLDIPIEKRNVGMVFQNYSLWPHMTVFENVAYGLRMRKNDSKTIGERVRAALHMVDMKELGDRNPAALSGGQQQRIALARALVYEPRLLLLDEPLSNLDAKLRHDMRAEIRALHKRLDITMVYVTHDQEEAAALADRMALLNGGRAVQVGTPEELYRQPNSSFAAQFFGKANLIEGTVGSKSSTGFVLETSIGNFSVQSPAFPVADHARLTAVIRPEDFVLDDMSSATNVLQGTVTDAEFTGPTRSYIVNVQGTPIAVMQATKRGHSGSASVGDRVQLMFGPQSVHLIEK